MRLTAASETLRNQAPRVALLSSSIRARSAFCVTLLRSNRMPYASFPTYPSGLCPARYSRSSSDRRRRTSGLNWRTIEIRHSAYFRGSASVKWCSSVAYLGFGVSARGGSIPAVTISRSTPTGSKISLLITRSSTDSTRLALALQDFRIVLWMRFTIACFAGSTGRLFPAPPPVALEPAGGKRLARQVLKLRIKEGQGHRCRPTLPLLSSADVLRRWPTSALVRSLM